MDERPERVQPSFEREGIPDHEGPLPEKAETGDPQEGLYPPQDDYVAADEHGVTAAEQREREGLDRRVEREEPDPTEREDRERPPDDRSS